MKLNKKGFTLIELLAVIVILAVVMLIAVTAVTPLMAKSRKGALADEGIGLISAGELAYEAYQLEGGTSPLSGEQCFTLQGLVDKGYYKKGAKEGYKGSVLIKPDGDSQFWISNGTYAFNGETAKYNLDHAIPNGTTTTYADASVNCNGKTPVF